MKTIKLIAIGTLLLLAGRTHAQVDVSITIGSPPLWGPVGYTEVRYYYLPDVYAYYDIQTSMFIYYGGGVWLHRAYLPSRYSSYDLYSGYKVVMTDYRGDKPYTTYTEYKTKYAKGYSGGKQKTIGERPAKGNTKAKASSGAKSGGKSAGPAKTKSIAPANNKSASHGSKSPKGDNGHSGGNGKKK
ncbi:MAG TPA: hypothetical protein VI757_12345 [Bacteroidia bacterium]|nr:hypothetical protein [Bacteroidia bacterium]